MLAIRMSTLPLVSYDNNLGDVVIALGPYYFLFEEGGNGLILRITNFWFALGVDGKVPENIQTLPEEGFGA